MRDTARVTRDSTVMQSSNSLTSGISRRKVIGPCGTKPKRKKPVWMHTPEVREWQIFKQRWEKWKARFGFQNACPS